MGENGKGKSTLLKTLVEIVHPLEGSFVIEQNVEYMDIMRKQALEQMLQGFEGTVLFVSHDRYFIKQVATGILEFGKDNVTQYDCGYEDYLTEKQKRENLRRTDSGKRNVTSSGLNKNGGGNEKKNSEPTLQDVFNKKEYYNPGKVKSRLLKQLEKYYKELAESEEKLNELQLRLMDPALASDYQTLMELQTELDTEGQLQEAFWREIPIVKKC